MNLMIGQLARRYKLPWRSSGMLTGSKITDAQAGYESAFNMFPIMLAGANYVMHCAGWTEAGLTASYAKFMLDAEQMEMLWKFGHGPRFEDFDEAVATIGEVGPGGHFLGTAHTQAHFQDAFFMSELFDNNSFEQWLADGAKDADDARPGGGPEGAGRLRRPAARPRHRRGAGRVHRQARARAARQAGLTRSRARAPGAAGTGLDNPATNLPSWFQAEPGGTVIRDIGRAAGTSMPERRRARTMLGLDWPVPAVERPGPVPVRRHPSRQPRAGPGFAGSHGSGAR